MAEPRTAPRSVVDLLGLAAAYLDARGFPSPRLDAELLLGHVLGLGRLELYLHHDRPLEPTETDGFRALLRRRGTGEPVAYLLGRWGFRGLELRTDARALVPRPETEGLVELALARLPIGGTLLDVGTGCGAIALAAARERIDARVVASDVSADALALARDNVDALGLDVELVAADLLDGLPAALQADVIVANLPYVASGDARLEPDVAAHEPAVALYGGTDGLELVRRLVAAAPARLRPAGTLALELGAGQAAALVPDLREQGWRRVGCERDLAGIDRYVLARREP